MDGQADGQADQTDASQLASLSGYGCGDIHLHMLMPYACT